MLWLLAVQLPREQKHQTHADADAAVGDVKGRKSHLRAAARLDVEVDEVHDMLVDDAVNDVADDAAEHETERPLAERLFEAEVVTREEEREQRKGE